MRLIQHEAGGPTAAAKLVNMSTSQFVQLRDGVPDAKTGKPRGMRKETARKIEKAADKPEGWLDIPHGDDLGPAPAVDGRVPLISWVQAGDFCDAIETDNVEEWVKTTVTVREHTFALTVRGDSMEPDFPRGVTIVVEPDIDHNPGDYVIVRNGDGEATFKQLVRDGSDLFLKPLNQRYPIKPLGDSRIVGVVREMLKKIK